MTKQSFKVAKIISDTTLVINAGTSQGIKKGDQFKIIGKYGTEPIIDPDTKENLGTLDDIKGTVFASEVYPHMSVCNSRYIQDSTTFFSQNLLATGANNFLKDMGHHEALNVDKTQITGGLHESNAKIPIGDIAQLVN